MSIAERVSSWLRERRREGYCDDCIAMALRLSRRQQAQRVTSALGTTAEFRRQYDTCRSCGSDKLVTRAL